MIFNNKFSTTSSNVCVSFYVDSFECGDLNLNPYYQREYVWKEKEQQEFLYTIFNMLPIGIIAISVNSKNIDGYYEVVDGKQRITTLLKFMNGEIPYIFNGKMLFYKDLSILDKRQLKVRSFPYVQLDGNITEKDKLEYFYRVNFTGVPQSEEHRQKIVNLIEERNDGC